MWVQTNELKMNNEKTEVRPCSTSYKLRLSCHDLVNIQVGDNSFKFSKKVKNLGVFLKCELSIKAQINNICKVGYFELSRLLASESTFGR